MRARGFTLIELLFVMLIVALLAAIVGPVLVSSIGNARESTLKEDLFVMRKAIDDYYADSGKYPGELADLTDKRYLRRIPVDPLTDRADSWVLVRVTSDTGAGGIIDVHSGSNATAGDGTQYRDW
jgi:general secretion pathway protein G